MKVKFKIFYEILDGILLEDKMFYGGFKVVSETMICSADIVILIV